ncbi:MAG: MarR family transcriptional regulator [Bifidobacterium sp.]|uniref:MarR family winged helix-turn-helix transcriptional regulator n=1 Tax=Bifidobacterium sp. TaxID=41200 RepID=UPI0039E7FA30
MNSENIKTNEDDTIELDSEFAETLHELWHAILRAARARRQLPSLPESQLDTLRRLAKNENMTPSQLASELDLSRSAISDVIQKLSSAKLIQREPSPSDGRSVVLTVTDKAKKILDEFQQMRIDVVRDALYDLPSRDARRLRSDISSLTRLLDRINKFADFAEFQKSHSHMK